MRRPEKRWAPTPLNILFFGLAFAADGVLGTTISVLLSGFMSTSQAIIGAGLIMAFRHVVGISLAFVSGPITDRIGAHRLLIPCTLVVIAGLVTVAAGYIYVGALVIICSRGILSTVGPVLAAREVDRSHRRARILFDLERCRPRGRRISRHGRCCVARIRRPHTR